MAPFSAGSDCVLRLLVAAGILICLPVASYAVTTAATAMPPASIFLPSSTLMPTTTTASYVPTSAALSATTATAATTTKTTSPSPTALTQATTEMTATTPFLLTTSETGPCPQWYPTATFMSSININDCRNLTVPDECGLVPTDFYAAADINSTLGITAQLLSAGAQFILRLCVSNSSALGPGQYELEIVVASKSSGPIFFRGMLTVVDPDPLPPSLTVTSSVVFVSERAPPGFTVFTVNVQDSDVDASFARITRVSLTSAEGRILSALNITLLDSNPSESNQTYSVVVATALNASVTQQYNLTITTTDGGGLSSSVNVTVTVIDENDPPVCHPDILDVNISLATPLYTSLGRFDCTDFDVTPAYRDIDITPASLFNGVVTLFQGWYLNYTSSISSYSSSSTEYINVSAPRYPEVNTGVTVRMNVFNSPPDCTGLPLFLELNDTAVSGTCFDNLVTCRTDGPGESLVFDASLLPTPSLPLQWTLVSGVSGTDSVMDFQLCATGPLLNHALMNETILLAVSSQASDTIMGTLVLVNDVNQPPLFLQPSYVIQLEENTPRTQLVASVHHVTERAAGMTSAADVISVWDPDNATNLYRLDRLTVMGAIMTLRNTQLSTNASGLPIQLDVAAGPPWNFTVRDSLEPGTYLNFSIQAQDGEGLADRANVIFVVNDVNDPPSCSSVLYPLTVPLATPVGSELLSLTCSDADLNVTFAVLMYGDYNGTNGWQYFSINKSGQISLRQQLPLDVTNLTYNAYVRDGGGLVTNVTVLIDIFSHYVPICSPTDLAFIFNDTAELSYCISKQLTCQYAEPSLQVYNLTFSYAVKNESFLYFVYEQGHGVIKVCPATNLVGRIGNYSLSVNVSTPIGFHSYNGSIIVVNGNRPPAFDQSEYNFTVSETLSNGSLVAQVVIGTSLPVKRESNVIYVTDPDTETAYGLIMAGIFHTEVNRTSFNNNLYPPGTGSIAFTSLNFSVAHRGRLAAGDRYVFALSAVDSGGLSATATVLITVTSVNGTPACDSSRNITVPLTLPVGTKVANLFCHFPNSYPPYNFVTNPAYMQGFWGMSHETGDVTLTSPLPVNISRVEYYLKASNSSGQTQTVVIMVHIDQWFPPDCSSTYLAANISETDVNSSCAFEITCVDSTGRGQNMDARPVSGNSGLSLVQNATLGGLRVAACVDRSSTDPSLLYLGNRVMYVVVSSDTGYTNLTFNITVLDVNQPPYFGYQNYSTRVREDVAGGTVLASIGLPQNTVPAGVVYVVVSDADVSPDYGLTNVTYSQRTVFDNGTVLDQGPFRPPIPNTYNQSITVLSSNLLRPDAVYFVFLTATDLQGLSGTATLTVNVEDVNQPPYCHPSSQSADLDLMASVGRHVFAVACTDDDHNITFRSLSYNMYMESDFDYFNVLANGSVILTTAVPRDVTLLTLKAFAVDGLGLTDNVTITFNVTRDYPPFCNVVYQPPTRVWVNGTCFEIHPNCSDPSTPGDSRYLTFNFTGNWTAGFHQTVSLNSSDLARFCYKLTQGGVYQIGLNVTNGLGVTLWEQTVLVVYQSAPPTFSLNPYYANVSELLTVGGFVVTVQAFVDTANVPLIYNITDGANYSQYLSINSSTGLISVARSLRPLADQSVTLMVKAEDFSSGLTGTAEVILTVTDVNEPPSCINVTVTIPWVIGAGEGVATVNCSDPDVNPANTNLTYAVRGSSLWTIVNGSVLVLANRSLLEQNPDVPAYSVSVNASDGPYVTVAYVTINLDRTLPKPSEVQILNVTETSADLTWTFNPLYRPLISNFVVNVTQANNVLSSTEMSPETRGFKVPDLSPGVTHYAYVTVNGLTGIASQTSAVTNFTTDNYLPPNCSTSGSTIAVDFLETDTNKTCAPTVVTCLDASGRGRNLTLQRWSDGTGGQVTLVESRDTSGALRLNSCVVGPPTGQSWLSVGQFQIVVSVVNVLAATNLTFNVTVQDVNQPPYFQSQNYSTRVREDLSSGAVVAYIRTPMNSAVPGIMNIVLDDPDIQTLSYRLANVTFSQLMEFDNGTMLDHGPFEPPKSGINQTISISAANVLRPDVVYSLFIRAKDGEGLMANCTVTVSVEDVNQPPHCPVSSPSSAPLNLLTRVGNQVYTLLCTDDDYNATYRYLTYALYNLSDYAYFNVLTNGSVTLAAAVPRDVTLLRLEAYAVDGLGLTDNVTITFNVTRDYPPDCDVVYQPPTGVWLNGTCFEIHPNCSDPSTPGDSRYLTFTLTGNWTASFRQTVSLNNSSFARFCYTLTQGGLYEIGLNVTNGLGVTTWQQAVHVVYLMAPPTFTSSSYVVYVNETAPVGSSVVAPTALVNNVTVPLVYGLSDTGGDNNSHFLSINSSTGLVTVALSLGPLSDQQFDFLVTALDLSSNLTGTTVVRLYVYDLDEPPTCTNVTVGSTWALSVGEGVAAVNCSDPDVSSENTNLSYTIRSTSEVAIWSLVNGSMVVLANRSQLVTNLPKSVFELTVDVTNNNFSVTTFVTISLNLTLPSPPVLNVVNISESSATLLWSLDDLYRPLIANFTVAVNDSGKPRISDTVVSSSATYVLKDLTPGVMYTAQLRANGIPGVVSVTSAQKIFQTQVYKQSVVEIQILNMDWDPRLSDNLSPEYSSLTSQLTSAIESDLRFRLKNGFVYVTIRSYRAGSVKAEVVVTTNQLTSSVNVQNNLTAIVRNGSLGGLVLNSSYVIYSQAFEVREASLVYTSPSKILLDAGAEVVVEGYDVTATCSARTVGDRTPRFQWTRGGHTLTNSSYYTVTGPALVNATIDSYRFYSHLVIRSISRSQSGDLTCGISAGNVSTASVNVSLGIISALFVTLNPDPSPFVTSGDSLSLNCTKWRSAEYAANWTATLYRYDVSGLVYESHVSKSLTDSSLASFRNISVNKNTTFVCRVDDSYANMTSANVSIHVIDKPIVTCKEEDPWPSIPAGQTVDIPCPEGYNISGKQFRTCLLQGVWSSVNTSSCVRQDIVDLLNKVELIAGGAMTAATGEVGNALNNITSQYGTFLVGDLVKSVDIMNRVATIINNDTSLTTSTQDLENYIKSADNLLHADEIWVDQTPTAFGLIDAVDVMSKGASKGLNSSETRPIATNKIVVVVGRSEGNLTNIEFPKSSQAAHYPDWLNNSKSSVFLDKKAFPTDVINVSYSVAMYNNLSNVFGGPLQNQSTAGQQNERTINSPIIALSVAVDKPLLQNVKLKFEHITANFSQTFCQFLDIRASQWSGEGCHRVDNESNSTVTVCTCNHLTNFALLMSSYRPSGTILDVLNTFTIVGCAVSIFFLLITLIIYCIFWEYLTKDRNNVSTTRSKILVNLCIILIIAYVTFLAGVNSVKDTNGCTAVAAILHYVWLVAFFLMLCEGIDIFISIILVFPQKSIFIWLMVMAYGVPAIIVAVSLGVTRLEGYGGEESCWLSVKNGVLWAFVGPALATLLANFIFVAMVISTLLKSTTMMTKSKRHQAKTIVKAICVMSPVLGLTWVFGVMGVNDETLVFQVLFVIFNSLQGLLIFIFHCLLAKQVRDAMKKKWKKYQTSKIDYSSSGNNSSSAKYSQKITSESNVSENDLGKSAMSSSPFLPADSQQMERPVDKVSSLERLNMLTHSQPIKEAHLKDPLAHTGAMGQGQGQTGATFINNIFIDDEAKEGRPVDVTDVGLNIAVDSPSFRPDPDPDFDPSLKDAGKEVLSNKSSLEDNRLYRTAPSNTRGETPLQTSYEEFLKISQGPTNVAKVSVPEIKQQLDHVYGKGSRIPGDFVIGNKPKKPGPPVAPKTSRRSSSSTELEGADVLEDHPAHRLTLKSKGMWVPADDSKPPKRSSKSPAHGHPHRDGAAAPAVYGPPGKQGRQLPPAIVRPYDGQPRPNSPPWKMAKSAESLGSPHHPYAFLGPYGVDGLGPSMTSGQMTYFSFGGPEPVVAKKAGRRHEPPPDY